MNDLVISTPLNLRVNRFLKRMGIHLQPVYVLQTLDLLYQFHQTSNLTSRFSESVPRKPEVTSEETTTERLTPSLF